MTDELTGPDASIKEAYNTQPDILLKPSDPNMQHIAQLDDTSLDKQENNIAAKESTRPRRGGRKPNETYGLNTKENTNK